jgi:uncharacterized protein (DUF433 family)
MSAWQCHVCGTVYAWWVSRCRTVHVTPGGASPPPGRTAEPERGTGVLSFRKGVQGGHLCFDGTRIPVETILSLLRDRECTDQDAIAFYPSLTQADLDAVRWWDKTWRVTRRRT